MDAETGCQVSCFLTTAFDVKSVQSRLLTALIRVPQRMPRQAALEPRMHANIRESGTGVHSRPFAVRRNSNYSAVAASASEWKAGVDGRINADDVPSLLLTNIGSPLMVKRRSSPCGPLAL
jgi:hypothetical protein